MTLLLNREEMGIYWNANFRAQMLLYQHDMQDLKRDAIIKLLPRLMNEEKKRTPINVMPWNAETGAFQTTTV